MSILEMFVEVLSNTMTKMMSMFCFSPIVWHIVPEYSTCTTTTSPETSQDLTESIADTL